MISGTVLVTGGDGFLGRRLIKRLKQRGVQVRAPRRADGFDILSDRLDLGGVDHVFHLAARTGVPAAWADPAGFHLVNAHGTVRVLDQCRVAGSSATYVSGFVYGRPERMPIREDDRVMPNNPYSFSKFMGEQACRFYAEAFGMHVNIARPFNIYGPGQDLRFLLPLIVDQAADPAVTEIVVKDLEPRRDFIHVDDVVDALIVIAAQPAAATFNIGSGESHSVRDVILAACRAAGVVKPVRSSEEPRQNEIMDVLADTQALRATGWLPAISLEQGMQSMIDEARDRLGMRSPNA